MAETNLIASLRYIAANSREVLLNSEKNDLREAADLIERLQRPDICPSDGMPCYVGKEPDDKHHRCGTSACGREQSAGTFQQGIEAARRLALYADECALILKQNGYPAKAQSLEAKARDVMTALKPTRESGEEKFVLVPKIATNAIKDAAFNHGFLVARGEPYETMFQSWWAALLRAALTTKKD